jgi:hypothetical protein
MSGPLELAENWGRTKTRRFLADTGIPTNEFSDSGDPLGVGSVVGYNWRPWNNPIMVGPFASLAGLTIVRSIQLKSSTVRPTASGWRATCSLSNASKASDISGCEGQARRGSILFRCERTYSCAVTLRAKINAAESCLTKQRWLLLLQPAKNREHIGLAAL